MDFHLFSRLNLYHHHFHRCLSVLGVIVLSILMCDRSIRRYSSMVYLMGM